MTTTKHSFLVLSLSATLALADTAELGTINVVESEEVQSSEDVAYSTTHKVEDLSKKSSGETLGEYLSSELGVDNASYGAAVGRPTVRGMEGYRIGIAQGGIMLNDLSAMSQDHAVGLNAKVVERIELAKGPASLLYGSYSGGIIRALGEEHLAKLPKEGLSLDLSLSSNSDTNKGTGSFKSSYATDTLALYLNYFNHQADNYSSNGNEVLNSDTASEQLHGVLAWQFNPNFLVKFYADTMDKAYGIPNRTPARTDILMEQERYGFVLHTKSLWGLKNIITEIQQSDYRHYEREDGRYDGLFDQQQISLSSKFDLDIGENTQANFRLELIENELKVCHEHGQCENLFLGGRTDAMDGASLLNYYNTTGIAYSHGHPMPDTKEQKVLLGINLKHYYGESDEFSLASNAVLRKLTPYSENMQETWLMHPSVDPDYYDEETKLALSLSLGWWHEWSDSLTTQLSLSYLERLPSSQELFWNGFHHATESYILGNRDLDKEQSINLDLDMLYRHSDAFSSKLSLYYYDFKNYIYQSPKVDASGTPMIDPFHLSPIWEMRGVGASIYGLGIEENYTTTIGAHQLNFMAQLNLLKGKLDEGGYIPRMSPYNATLSLAHKVGNWDNLISYKWVDESRNEAVNETHTEGYQLLNLSSNYRYTLDNASVEFWVKGTNLTDEVAKNHISFLKESAPLAGRAFTLGVRYQY
ncbi:MAG: TonB-dependent receptor [Campylobacterota bacterium]|nr:TonB-dependent receptor [Campylobacterota bacterium]